MGRNITETPKGHILGERRHMTYRSSKSVHRCDMCAWWRNQKRKTKKETWQWAKMGIRRDHPRLRIEMKFCVVAGLQMVVLRFEFHQNRLSSFGAVGDRNLPIPIDLAIDLHNRLYYRTSREKSDSTSTYIRTDSFPFCSVDDSTWQEMGENCLCAL